MESLRLHYMKPANHAAELGRVQAGVTLPYLKDEGTRKSKDDEFFKRP